MFTTYSAVPRWQKKEKKNDLVEAALITIADVCLSDDEGRIEQFVHSFIFDLIEFKHFPWHVAFKYQ